MASFSELTEELVLALLRHCDIETWVAVGLTCKRFSFWFDERIFWISALNSTKLSRPIACPFFDDLAKRPLAELKDIGLRTLRLEHNWSLPKPATVGPVRSVDLGSPRLDIIFQIPGTQLYLLHAKDDATIVCWNMGLEKPVSSPLRATTRFVDVSPGQEDPGSYSMGLLLLDEAQNSVSMAIVKAAYNDDKAVKLSYTFHVPLARGFTYWAMFLTRQVVGVMAQPHGLPRLNVLAYNIVSKLSTLIDTDIFAPEIVTFARSASTTCHGELFILFEEESTSRLHHLPKSILPTDDKVVYPKVIKFSGTDAGHCNIIDWKTMNPDLQRRNTVQSYSEGLLSADPCYGVPGTSIHRHDYLGTVEENAVDLNNELNDPKRSRVEIRFWTSNKGGGSMLDTAGNSDSQEPHTLVPHSSTFMQGIVHELPESAWRLILISHSGRVSVMVLDVGKGQPVLNLVRFHLGRKEITVHTLELPDTVSLADITGLAVDDFSGVVSLLNTQGIIFFVPYA